MVDKKHLLGYATAFTIVKKQVGVNLPTFIDSGYILNAAQTLYGKIKPDERVSIGSPPGFAKLCICTTLDCPQKILQFPPHTRTP